MRIGGAAQGGSPTGAGMMSGTDAVSRDIQRQIEETKKQIQELSENQKMTPEEKMKKRQELQKRLAELTNQLRQHQVEERRQKQQEKKQGTSMDDLLGNSRKMAKSKGGPKAPGAGMSKAGMKALISADTAMKQAGVQGSVAAGLEGRAGVLEAEIKQDGGRGLDVSGKQEELAKAEQRASDTLAAQGETLGEAVQEARDAAKAEQDAGKSQVTKQTGKDGKTAAKEADGNAAALGAEGKAAVLGAEGDKAIAVEEEADKAAPGTEAGKDAAGEEVLGLMVDIRL